MASAAIADENGRIRFMAGDLLVTDYATPLVAYSHPARQELSES